MTTTTTTTNAHRIADDTLTDRIAAFRSAIAKQAPGGVLATIDAEIEELVRAGVGSGAPRVGERAPDFVLPNAVGDDTSLADALARGPVVLAFYRGQWCPYCDLQLRAYQEALPRIGALGATLIAVSPQTPDESLSTVEKRALAFPVLSDAGNEVARRYGLVFRLSATFDALQRGFGVDLAKSNGDSSNELPVPGTFIVDRDGHVTYAYVEADFRKRLDPSVIVAELERLAAARRA